MDTLFGEMIATLREAQQAVEHELEQILLNQSSSSARLTLLQESVGALRLQASSLLEMMAQSDADAEPMNVLEDIVDFFSDTEARIAATLTVSRG